MLKKILRKAIAVLDLLLGRIYLFLEKTKLINPIPFSVVKKTENAVFVNHALPSNFIKKDGPLFDHYTRYHSANEEVFELHKVNVSDQGVVFTKFTNFKYAFPHVVFRATYGWRYIAGQYLTRKRKTLPSSTTYVLIYDFWSAANYYHWLLDTLPRLLSLIRELEREGYALLLPAKGPGFIDATLRYFNVKNVLRINHSEFVTVDRLLVPHYLVGSGHIQPVKMLELKRYFLEKVPATTSGKLLYVSRGKQKTRLVHNEAELIAFLKPLGFEVIYFEDHSFEAQLGLIKNARVMISSHGANLANSLFLPDGSSVLELIRDEKPNFCYWAVCNAALVNYNYQLCRVIHKDHLVVDLELFKLNLQKILHA